MQFLLSKYELERGSQLFLAWKSDELTLDDVYIVSENLNEQGYFTVIRALQCDEDEEQKFVIDVYQRSVPLIQIG